jgi:ribonuclease HII
MERALWDAGHTIVAGTDEVGRGCLAGPVVAAAVVFAPGSELVVGVYDSKKLSHAKRKMLKQQIEETAMCVGVGQCSVREIDELNIRNASLLAMRRAIEALASSPDHVLVDGDAKIPDLQCSSYCVVKGDSMSHSIAAASIVAKVVRDEAMEDLSRRVDGYACWAGNKGYATPSHYDAIEAVGLTEHHRTSFRCERKRKSTGIHVDVDAATEN